MRSCTQITVRSALILIVTLASFAPARADVPPQAAPQPASRAMLFLSGASLLERQLPPFVQVSPGQFLAAAELQRACMSPAVRPDSLLLFQPDTRRCEQLSDRDLLTLPNRVRDATGHLLSGDLRTRLQSLPFIALAPPPRVSIAGYKVACICASNSAPVGTVACEAQSRPAGRRIANVEFLASDADGDTLLGEFSHQRDAEPVQAGLPAPLTSSCAAELGTLQCTVAGNAPAEPGALQLRLAVSDHSASIELVSLLEVIAAGEGIVFGDGFETPVCP